MQNLSERQRIEIALIWACALLLIYLFALAPLLTAERTAALVQRDRSRAQLARVEEYQHTLLSDGQAEEKLRVRMARAVAALPNESGQGAFVHRAEQLARRSGVTIEGIVLHAPREEEEIVIRPVELKFYGGYFQILDFLRAVQEDERAVQFGHSSPLKSARASSSPCSGCYGASTPISMAQIAARGGASNVGWEDMRARALSSSGAWMCACMWSVTKHSKCGPVRHCRRRNCSRTQVTTLQCPETQSLAKRDSAGP